MGHSGDLIWNIGLSISGYKNKIEDLPGGSITDGFYGYQSLVQAGLPAGLIMGYRSAGIYQTAADAASAGLKDYMGVAYKAGDPQYMDLNGDKIIDYHDMQVIGNPNPNFYGGVTADLSYKNFDLEALFSYSWGNDVLNVLRSKLTTGQQYQNQSTAVNNRFIKDGDVTEIARSTYAFISHPMPSSAFIEDGSYLKLKTLTLTYNLKETIGFVRNSQIYISGYNLINFTKYLGWDPEVTGGQSLFSRGYDFGNYPTSRMFMLGIKVGL